MLNARQRAFREKQKAEKAIKAREFEKQHGLGIAAQIKKAEENPDGSVAKYNKLTYEVLDQHLKDMGRTAGKSVPFTMFTGAAGMHDFDFMMKFYERGLTSTIPHRVHTVYRMKNSKVFWYVSLYSKHGRFKVKIRQEGIPFVLMDGTKEICQSDSNDSLNAAIKKHTHP